VRHRYREQHPHHPRRAHTGRPDGELRPLRPLARGFRPRAGDGYPLPPLWPAAAPDAGGARPLRLELRRRNAGGPEAARHHADHRPVPFRRARLAAELPKPGLPGAVRALRRRLRRAFPVGATLHPGQRDVYLRDVLRPLRLVERTAEGRPLLRHRAEAHRQSQCAGDAGDPEAARGRNLHPEREQRIFPRGEPGGDRSGRVPQLDALPVARPQLRPPRRQL
ncbi:MAG: GH1, partial [uncultured Sphingomonadaceae bacterium]